MSILRNCNWEHTIDFIDGSYSHIFIENPITLRNYIIELYNQINGNEGNFILVNEDKEIPIQKNILLLTDPLNIEFEEKKINTKINKDLLEIAQSPEMQQSSFSLISTIENYAEHLLENYPYNISFEIIDEARILKAINFHIEMEYQSPADKIIEWLNTSHDILGINNFIIVNSLTYFSFEEFEILKQEASAAKHNILFIDSQNKYNFKNVIIIDKDNCEIF